jgi:hypothetical protein
MSKASSRKCKSIRKLFIRDIRKKYLTPSMNYRSAGIKE